MIMALDRAIRCGCASDESVYDFEGDAGVIGFDYLPDWRVRCSNVSKCCTVTYFNRTYCFYNCPGQLVLGSARPPWTPHRLWQRKRPPLSAAEGQRPLHTPAWPRRGGAGGAVPHRGVPGAANSRDLQLSGRGASRRRCHPGAAGAAGAEQRLHGGFPPPHGRHGAAALVEIDRQGPQRLCEENRPESAVAPVETAAELEQLTETLKGASL